MEIKAVVFDIGDVVLIEKNLDSKKVFAERFGFSEEEFELFVKERSELSYLGKFSIEDFFGELKVKFNIQTSVEELIRVWKEIRLKTTRFDEGVLGIIKSLRENYLLASLTDTTVHSDVIREELKVYDLFDVNVVSTRVGVRKPDKKIYEILLERLESEGILPEEVVFVDDEIENLEPAMELGMKTILFEGVEMLEAKLALLGVEI